jgi:leader peptidase (prepilin peptidase)/N-methyltransferase
MIRWHQNLPVLSWVLLAGRCGACREPISLRYPVVEVLNGVLWAGLGLRLGLQPTTFVLLPFVSAMVVLFFTDWDHRLLPDRVTLPLAAVGLVLSPISAGPFGLPPPVRHWVERAVGDAGSPALGEPASRLAAALAGAALGYGLFWSLGAVWGLLRGEEALGGGDLKLMLGVGAFLGPGGVLLTVALGSIAGSIVGITLMAARSAGWRSKLPYGCFLAPAAVVAAFAGRDLVGAYLRLTGIVP